MPLVIQNYECGGTSVVSQHSKTAIHVNNEKQMRSQRTFKTIAGSLIGCFKPSTKHQVLNAAVLQVLNMVDKNHSFSSANGGSDRFKKCSRTRKLLRNILKKK